MTYKHIPNLLTILRIILVIPCALFLLYDHYKAAIGIFLIAAVTDGFDGLIARKLSCQSSLGAILDPIADKVLVVALFSVMTIKGFIPSWFALLVIVRELILLSGAAFYRCLFGPIIFIPTMLSKINTCLLLLLLLMALLQGMQITYSKMLNNYLIGLIVFTSLYSGLDYILKWSKRVYKTLQAS